MINKKSWKEFRESGLFWLTNTFLHAFGWALVVELDKESKEITSVYPARVKFRGFDEKTNTDGYIKISKYIKDNADELLEEAKQ